MFLQDRLQNLALIVVLVLLSSVLLEPTIRLAYRIGLVDKPDATRKLHTKTTAYMGGALLWFCMSLALIAGTLLKGWGTFGWILAAFTILFATGIVDDAVNLRPSTKLVFQIAAVVLMVLERMLSIPSFGWNLPSCLSVVVLVIVGTGVVNAFNLIDGLDGLSLGLGILTATPLFLYGLGSGDIVGIVIGLAFVATATGLLRGNLHPAKIFLGDSGSLLIGGVVFALALRQAGPGDGLFEHLYRSIIPLAVCIPTVDMVLVMIRRWRNRVPVFQGDRSHLHHRLQRVGLTHEQTVGWIHAAMTVVVVFEIIIGLMGISAGWNLVLLGLWCGTYAALADVENSRKPSIQKGVVHVP